MGRTLEVEAHLLSGPLEELKFERSRHRGEGPPFWG